MAFTEYRFDSEQIDEVARQRAANLKANKGLSDFPGFALGVIARRLAKDPTRYRDYGPYWWALKALLFASGREWVGKEDDAALRAVYTGQDAASTIVMADEFRSLYLQTFPVGTNQFTLDDAGDSYTVFDLDMEA